MLDSFNPRDCSTPSPSPIPGVYPKSCPLSVWCHPAISSTVIHFSPPAFNLSQHQGLFKWVSSSHQVVKYWRFSFNINPSNEYSGLISFRMDWLDLLAVQGTLKSLLQHLSSKASILWWSAFLMVRLSHPYTTTGKTPSQSFEHLSLCPTNNQVVISDYGLYSLPQPLCPESSYRQQAIE